MYICNGEIVIERLSIFLLIMIWFACQMSIDRSLYCSIRTSFTTTARRTHNLFIYIYQFLIFYIKAKDIGCWRKMSWRNYGNYDYLSLSLHALLAFWFSALSFGLTHALCVTLSLIPLLLSFVPLVLNLRGMEFWDGIYSSVAPRYVICFQNHRQAIMGNRCKWIWVGRLLYTVNKLCIIFIKNKNIGESAYIFLIHFYCRAGVRKCI